MTTEEILVLFATYHDMVYRIALSITRSRQDAEDLTQSVFLKLLNGAERPQAGKERAWLTKVAINASRDLLRSYWWKHTEPLEDLYAFEQPEESALFAAVMDLPAKYRVVVHLHYYEGYTCAEIGEFLSLSASAISMRLHRARMILRRTLEEEYYEDFISAHI